jgi:xylulokinase
VTRRAFLGIDCGTQSTKALLVDAESEAVLGLGRAAHQLIERADGTREQQPDWWIEALIDSVRGALAQSGAVEVAGIGVSGQQHGLVPLGGDDQPVRPAKLWNDTTTAEECRLLTDGVGGVEEALKLTGNSFLPGYTAPKVLWLKRHEPEAYSSTLRMCLPHDYLNLWLTGEFATEPGDASGTAYFDVRARHYSDPVLNVLDAERSWKETLPPLVQSTSVLGRLRGRAADALGLRAGVPLSGGGGDNMMAAIGTGAVEEGPVVVSLGTSGTVFAYRSQPAVDPRGEASAFCDSTGGWLPLVTTLNCTVVTDWIATLFGLNHAAVEEALASSQPGARGLTLLPHLEGERTPNVPNGAGLLAGVRVAHTSGDLVRATFEGVTFGLRYAAGALARTGVQATQLTLVGGGAASDGWAQMCADIFQVPVVRPPQTEAAALGAARQARWAVDGRQADWRVAVDAHRFEPRASPELEAAAARADRLRGIALRASL